MDHVGEGPEGGGVGEEVLFAVDRLGERPKLVNEIAEVEGEVSSRSG